MNTPPTVANPSFSQWIDSCRKHRRLILVPTLLAAFLAIVYASVRPIEWRATQALLVRDEAGGAIHRQGRFDSSEAMKTAQETIAQISRNQAVAAAALQSAGPPGIETSRDWPTRLDIEEFQRQLSLTAPKGQEFGTSEVIYLSVLASTRERASALALAVCDQLEARLKELRDRKAQSIVAELTKAFTLAQRDLDAATKQLATLETEVGSDLGELRILNDSGAGDSNLRTLHTQVRNELRQARLAYESNEEQLRLLDKAQKSPDALLSAKGLLDSHPTLRRLKDGLVDAQLRTAQLLGKMNADHPEVRAASAAEDVIRRQLREELATLVKGVEADQQVSQSQIDALTTQQSDVEQRLNRLAALRASYSNLVARARQCSETLQRAQKDVADARATQAAAQSASLITRLEAPVVGDAPEGASAATIVAAGVVGGLLAGLALVFLAAPPASLQGRRWTDYLPRGRRSTDSKTALRRESDRAAANPAGTLPPGEDRRSGADRRGAVANAGTTSPAPDRRTSGPA